MAESAFIRVHLWLILCYDGHDANLPRDNSDALLFTCFWLKHEQQSTSRLTTLSPLLRLVSRQRRQSKDVQREVQPRTRPLGCGVAGRCERRTHLQLDPERPKCAREHAPVR